MSKAAVHRATVRIAASHPALPGHFPGRPIVPAVVLLAVCAGRSGALARRWPVGDRKLSQAKFTAPLLPEQTAQLQLTLRASELRFSLTRDATACVTRAGSR